MGSCAFTLEEIRDKTNFKRKLTSKGIYIGEIMFYEVKSDIKYTFLDYVFGGCELMLLVAVDFTKSNGDIKNPESLHYLAPNDDKDNEYVEAIRAVGEILIYYDSDKKIPALGFGAKIPPLMDKACHCFALTENIFRPEVSGIEELLFHYKAILRKIDFHGPTHFTEVLRFLNEYATSTLLDNNQFDTDCDPCE